jgi:transposase-like protein
MRTRRRFTPEFKAKVVLEVLSGRQSPSEACRRHVLSPNLPGLWKATFLERAHTLLQPDEQRDEDQGRIAELEQLLGRAMRQIEILKKASTLLDAASTRDGR